MAVAAQAALHQGGVQFVASAGQRSKTGRKIWLNKVFIDYPEAEKWLAARNKAGFCVYIKHATFNGRTDDRGRPLTTLQDVVGSRSFFVDVDFAGHEPQYASENDAIQGVALGLKTLQELNLPQPNLVQMSGGGFQLVWTMTEPMQLQEWRLANGTVYALLQNAGMRLDGSAAAPERGVRLCGPEWSNWKTGKARATRVISTGPAIPTQAMRDALAPHRLTVVPFATQLKDEQDEYDIPIEHIWHVADSLPYCGVLQSADATGGADHGFVTWSNLIALVARDSDPEAGRRWAHKFSEEHEQYEKADVNKKFDDFLAKGRTHITCRKLQEGPSCKPHCDACRFKGRVTSPAGLPKAVREAQAKALPPLPDERYYNAAGGLMVKGVDEDKVVMPGYHITDVRLHEEGGGKDQISMRLSTTNAGWGRLMSIKVADMSDGRAMRKEMGSAGMLLPDYAMREMHNAMCAWMSRIRERQQEQQSASHLGWDADNRFVLSGAIHTPDKVQLFMPDATLKPFAARGSRAGFDRIMTEIMRDEARPVVHAHLATTLAAPLLCLTGINGILVNFCSTRSGFGKTTITKLACAFWAAPSVMMLGIDDTMNAMMQKLGILKHLPGYMDDPRFNEREAQAIVERLVYRTSHGMEKNRLSSSSRLLTPGSWQTPLIFASNASLTGTVTSRKTKGDAAAARTMEFTYTGLAADAQDRAARVQMLVADLEQQCGHYGPLYAAYLVKHRDQLRAQLESVNAQLMRLARAGDSDMSGRMQSAMGAAMIIGAMVAEREGWFAIETAKVKQAVLEALGHATRIRGVAQAQMTALQILLQYITAKSTQRVKTMTTDGTRRLHMDHGHVVAPVLMETHTTPGELYVDIKEFTEYLTEHGLDFQSTMVGLRHYPQRALSLAAGTTYSRPATLCFIIPLAGPFEGLR